MRIFILSLCLFFLFGCNYSSQKKEQTSYTRDRLYSEGVDSILVAVDTSSFNKLMTTADQNPDSYVEVAKTLLIQEKAFFVSNNSKILILNKDTLKSEIKVLEGEKKDKTGWVLSNFIKQKK